MIRLSEYISSKYHLKCEVDIDLKISSENVSEKIIVTPVDDKIYIKYGDGEIVSTRRMMYKDISYLLDHLSFIYFISSNNDILHEITYDGLDDTTLIDVAEDFIWKNHNDMDIYKIFVLRFAGPYNFEATISGPFVDTYWPIFDSAHFSVIEASQTKYKYRTKEYAKRYKALLTNIIPSEYNKAFLRKYFLDTGYAFLVDIRDEENKNVYQLIDIDFDNLNSICENTPYLIMSSDYESIIVYDNNKFYIRGKIVDEYPTLDKIIQIDDEPCRFIHSLKTSRILYKDRLYEASGKTISDCLNKLNKLLDNKILCCFTCKYGNYTIDEKNIYCLNGFKPKDFSDVLYIVDETKMIPYDQFNLCDMFEYPNKDYYQHTLFKEVEYE